MRAPRPHLAIIGKYGPSVQSPEDGFTGRIPYTYDLSGALASETYPSGRTVTNIFDAAGRVSRLQGTKGGVNTNYVQSVTYVPQGVNVLTLGNGLTESWSYGTAQKQPTGLVVPGKLSLGWGYGADASDNGNIVSASISATPPVGTALTASQAFSYDKVNRLKTSSEGLTPSTTGVWSRNYTYDQFGNGWVSGYTGITPSSFTPQSGGWINAANNRLVNSGMNVGYDGGAQPGPGNLTSIGAYTYAYDAENRMLTSSIGGVTTTYTYDGDGRRVQKATGSAVTAYVYDAAGQLAAEYATSPTTSPCATCYLTADYLGSTRMVTNGSGVVQSFTDYQAFGEEIQSGVGNRSASYYPPNPLAVADGVTQKFTGKERDQETGLDFFGARYFSSAQGRFTSTDPVLLSKQRMIDPQQWNLYSYVRNNPLRLLDPDGREVKVLDEEALKRIRSTLPESLRAKVTLNKKGFIDKKALNKISSKDANFNDLKTAVNSSATLEVSTAKSADMGKYGQVEFFFTSKEQVAAERAATGAISDSEPIDQLFLGKTSGKEETESGNTQVVLSDGTGKAATAPEVEQAATAAHEIYGHGLPNMQGLPWKHDRGPVDANVIRIEDRTRQLYDKNP